jgi:hypothetical protein
MRMYRFYATVLSVVFLLGLSVEAWAQSGTISGTVSDSTGAVIASAQVSARDVHTDTTRTTTTNSQGFYEFIAVKPST